MGTGDWGHMSGAQGVVDSLRRAGATRVFGLPSVENSLLFEALRGSGLELVLATREAGAAMMADAHARLTGSVGVCLLSAGPGLLSALEGIAQARRDSSPLLVLIAGAPSGGSAAFTEPFPEARAAVRPLCKETIRVEAAEEVPLHLSRALRLCREGEPGPVVVEIPREVQRERARMEGTGFRPGPRVLDEAAEAGLKQALSLIERSPRICLYVGAGAVEAAEEVAELAVRLGAPVASTISGLGVLPFIHPWSVGFGPGPAGNPVAEKAFADCTLLLAVGCRFAEAATGFGCFRPGVPMVHVDVAPRPLNASFPKTLQIAAPARLALRYLLDRLAARERPELCELIRNEKRALRSALDERPELSDAVDPIRFFRVLRELLAGEDVLVLDCGQHAFYALSAFPVMAPRRWLMPVDFRSAGFAVPAAVAAKLALPENHVVACVGDAGFAVSGFELLTARRCNVSPVVAVFADENLGLVRAAQEKLLGRESCVDLVPVDYQKLAESLGVAYLRARRDAELGETLRRALTLEAPVILEVRASYRESPRFLQAVLRSEWERMPRSLALRLGARMLLRRLFGRR
ncbi:MAG: thiamine pyrophosphate-binding protein [Myxococcales bacterium]|nr:thiamine pyrophosphate-binding protein [Myxococcales bacterium]